MNNHIPHHERLIVALDMPSAFSAKILIRTLDDSVGFYKIGMELFTDPYVYEVIALLKRLDKKVFIDLKYYDIPETVYRATSRLVDYGIDFMTVHSTPQTVEAAAKAASDTKTKVLAVTVLTSIDQNELTAMGLPDYSIAGLVLSRTSIAIKNGADGVVCSGLEAKLIRDKFVNDIGYIVTPGIRSNTDATKDDQKRICTIEQAFKNGADYIVVGRPIRDVSNPIDAANSIQNQIRKTCKYM